jgi:hypothetical protein
MIDSRSSGVFFGEVPGEGEGPVGALTAVVVRVTKENENVKMKEIRTLPTALHNGFFIIH